MLGAILFAQKEMKASLDLIDELVSQADISSIEHTVKEDDDTLKETINKLISSDLEEAYQNPEKSQRQEMISELMEKVKTTLEESEEDNVDEALGYFKSLESEIVRTRLLEGKSRIDGRDLDHIHIVTDDLSLNEFKNQQLAEIYMCHILEHLSFSEVVDAINIFYTKLKVGGIIIISVPDFNVISKIYSSSGEIELIKYPLMGGQDYSYNFHKLLKI